MLLEKVLAHEAHAAAVADERLFSSVKHDVVLQVAAAGEGARTDVALEWLLAGVRAHVDLESRVMLEAAATVLAPVVHLVAVHLPVRLERLDARKPLVALLALVRLFTGVHTNVLAQ